MALIVGVLVLSCALVLSELVFRFTNRHLKYRFIDTAMGHWIVFTVLTLMIGFTRRNDASQATFKIRFVFVPIHLLFFSLILCGWLQPNSTFCSEHTFPHIFIWQYVLFIGCYILTLYFYKNDFFLKWHKDTDIVLRMEDGEEMPPLIDEVKKKRIKARMIFREQSRRFVCFYSWLTFLTLLSMSSVLVILNKRGGAEFGCAPDGTHW